MTLKKTIFLRRNLAVHQVLSLCVSLICSSFKSLTTVISLPRQERIHTSFHCFTEIGQILHSRYIFNKEKTFQVARLYPRRMKLANIMFE